MKGDVQMMNSQFHLEESWNGCLSRLKYWGAILLGSFCIHCIDFSECLWSFISFYYLPFLRQCFTVELRQIFLGFYSLAGWLQTANPPISASPVTRFQKYVTSLRIVLMFAALEKIKINHHIHTSYKVIYIIYIHI